MSARNVSNNTATGEKAARLRKALAAATPAVRANDPLKLKRDELDAKIRRMRETSRDSLVEAIG